MEVTRSQKYTWNNNPDLNRAAESTKVQFQGAEESFTGGDGQVEEFIPGQFRDLDQLGDLLTPDTARRLQAYQIDRADFPSYNAPLKLEVNGQKLSAGLVSGSYYMESGDQTIKWTPGRSVELHSRHSSDDTHFNQSIVAVPRDGQYVCIKEEVSVHS